MRTHVTNRDGTILQATCRDQICLISGANIYLWDSRIMQLLLEYSLAIVDVPPGNATLPIPGHTQRIVPFKLKHGIIVALEQPLRTFQSVQSPNQ